MIPSWSHSRIVEFEKCKARAALLYIDKVPEPQRPLPPGKTEHANDRGTRIHEGCETFVRGTSELPAEASNHFKREFDALHSLYQQGRVSLEGEWGMSQAWEPVPWRGEWLACPDLPTKGLTKVKALPAKPQTGDTVVYNKQVHIYTPPWLRLKLDAIVHVDKREAIAIDFKSGRKFGNELKHAEQLQLYQLVTFLRYPLLEVVHTELWYLDQDDITTCSFTRDHGLRFKRSWDARGTKLTTAVSFPANPNVHSCQYCMYGPWGTGDCKVGVRR